MVSTVYGPQGEEEKERFLSEIIQYDDQVHLQWILNGYFNLVCREEERNSRRVNRRLMQKFRHTINRLGLHDMPMVGRRFTWCNQQEHSIMARLDRLFLTTPGKIYILLVTCSR